MLPGGLNKEKILPHLMTHSLERMQLLHHEMMDNGTRVDNLTAIRLIPSTGARRGHLTKIGPP